MITQSTLKCGNSAKPHMPYLKAWLGRKGVSAAYYLPDSRVLVYQTGENL